MPSTISIRATAISIVRPSRGGITMVKSTIAPPTATIVNVCPTPHKPPIKRADRDGGLAGDDRADRDHMIGVSGVTHAEKKAQQGEGKDRDHMRVKLPRDPWADPSARNRGDCGFQA